MSADRASRHGGTQGGTEDDREWERRFRLIAQAIGAGYRPSVNRIAEATPQSDPFRVLVSTVISLRTKDDVTFAASDRLLAEAPDAPTLATMSTGRIQELIYPAGFYRTKAKNLRSISQAIADRPDRDVPRTQSELRALPGVGPKTANLVLGIGFGIPAICVDTHVHRIPNRLGWISTTNPEQSEQALMEILPRRFWIAVNELLVAFGQTICTPQSPWCSRCPLSGECARVGVTRSR